MRTEGNLRNLSKKHVRKRGRVKKGGSIELSDGRTEEDEKSQKLNSQNISLCAFTFPFVFVFSVSYRKPEREKGI